MLLNYMKGEFNLACHLEEAASWVRLSGSVQRESSQAKDFKIKWN